MTYSELVRDFCPEAADKAAAVGISCAINSSGSRQASAPQRWALLTNSRTGHSRISLDKGLLRLMVRAVAPTPLLTALTSATISLGRSRSACRSRLFKPLKLPTTSKSRPAAKRCLTTRPRAGEPTTKTLTSADARSLANRRVPFAGWIIHAALIAVFVDTVREGIRRTPWGRGYCTPGRAAEGRLKWAGRVHRLKPVPPVISCLRGIGGTRLPAR